MMPSSTTVCRPKYLPRERWIEAAQQALRINPENAPPGADLDELLVPERGRLAANLTKYWGRAGVRLTVGFLDNPPPELRRRLLAHMNAWSERANVAFVESSIDAQVRVARMTESTAPPGMDGC